MPEVLQDQWPRFFVHWLFTTIGFFLRSLIPVLESLRDPGIPIQYPRWWVAVLLGAIYSLIGGIINSNLPLKPREMLKSVAAGFALESISIPHK